jgi:ADP-ribose pyrophosphatase YjhB (NUDIX family)
MIGGKFVVVRHKSGDFTFPGGGCKQSNTHEQCAMRELVEETKKAVQKGTLEFLFSFETPERSAKELANNKKEKITVTTTYKVFSFNIEGSFNKIKNNYNSGKLLNNKEKTNSRFTETTGIHLMSLENMNKSTNMFYSIVRTNILPKLKANYRKTPNGRS